MRIHPSRCLSLQAFELSFFGNCSVAKASYRIPNYYKQILSVTLMNTVIVFLQKKIVLAPIVTVPEKYYASPFLKSFLICVTGIIALELVLFYLDNLDNFYSESSSPGEGCLLFSTCSYSRHTDDVPHRWYGTWEEVHHENPKKRYE